MPERNPIKKQNSIKIETCDIGNPELFVTKRPQHIAWIADIIQKYLLSLEILNAFIVKFKQEIIKIIQSKNPVIPYSASQKMY